MSKKITGAEYSLSKIFSSDFSYSIPPYQRPYAWTTEETGVLFDDLYDFFRTEEEDDYFLGSIVLIKEDNKPPAEVVDGQQRLTTLTILLSTIASRFTEGSKRKGTMQEYICEPGNEFEGLKPSPRLRLREKDSAFFEEFIQNDKLIELTKAKTNNEAQKHIQENTALMLQKLNNTFSSEEALFTFVQFLMNRCFIVAVTTPSQESAFRVFSILNSRGLDLLPIDIIKADILGKISSAEQEEYTEKWENLEEMTSRSGFNDLFGHIRMIFAKLKAKRTLLEEFKTQVLSTPENAVPKDFIDKVLTPFADAYTAIKGKSYEAVKNAEEINFLLGWLNKINNSDWMPPAVYFMAKNNDPDYLLWFFERLERLAAYLHITAKDVNARIERYAKVIKEIDDNPTSSIENPIVSIELTDDEKTSFLDVLNGEIYLLTAVRRNYIILRLDSFVSDKVATYADGVLTIEHVLPQAVDSESEWDSLWPALTEMERMSGKTDNRKLWLNRIANLVPLSRSKNSAAQNYDFDRKKREYFTGKSGTSSYCLTTQVLHEPEWTPEVVSSRQETLLKVFKDKWQL